MISQRVIPEELMAEFSRFLNDVLGLYFPKERWNELEKKFLLIMGAFGVSDPSVCLQLLKQDPFDMEKVNCIAHYLTVGETSFFRDPFTFRELEHRILPEIIHRHHKDRTIRIWCAGCCTGEEPYSIAIVLHRLMTGLKSWDIRIVGTDVNREFLNKAEQARYKKWSFRSTPPEIIDRYFIKHADSTYSLIPDIKQSVKFNYFNLAAPANSMSNFSDMDLVLCHNVLIYFSKEQIKKSIQQFTKTLALHGWLSVGAIEAPFVNHEELSPHEFSGAFFFRKEHPQRVKKESGVRPFDYPIRKPTHFNPEIREFSPAIAAARDHAPKAAVKLPSIEKEGARGHPQADNQTEETIYEKCLRLSHKKQFEDVITILLFYLLPYKKEGHALRDHLKEVILLIHMYANQGELPFALEWCAEALKHDKLDPALHYLHATVLQALDDSPNAIKSLRRSLFLDSDFAVSHYMLGLLEQEKGNHKAAFRSFKTALELLDAYQAEDVLPGTDDLTAGRLKNILSARLEK